MSENEPSTETTEEPVESGALEDEETGDAGRRGDEGGDDEREPEGPWSQ